jgi:hypothetical protein
MQIKRKIHKDKWALIIVTPREMKKHADGDKDTAGLCVAHAKTIYIRNDSVEYAVIAHELFHAYWSYLYLSDTNDINLTDAEEIGASFFAAEGEEMVKKAKQYTRELQKLHGTEGQE